MTTIVALKPGHDGAIAVVAGDDLLFSFEGEKDSQARNGPVGVDTVVTALQLLDDVPDVVAVGGWYKTLPGLRADEGAGYEGLASGTWKDVCILGRPVRLYHSSHERSHLFGAMGMAPFDAQGPAAVLVWEGVIGAFYRWDDGGRSIRRIDVLDQPGARYSALYDLADPSFPPHGGFPIGSSAGKLMALAGYASSDEVDDDSRQVVDTILGLRSMYPFDKQRFRRSPLFDCGFDDPRLHAAASYLTDALFERFREAAAREFTEPRPLAIAGGCGLNCDWNSAWERSGLFSEVFVPPCPNDSGSAIGTALDARAQLTGDPRISWDVYRGQPFEPDVDPVAEGWRGGPLHEDGVSAALERGEIVAWVQGRCEIGPRALGHRSLLASAADPASKHRLNTVKEREDYRPIAPVCRIEEVSDWFDDASPDPWMLRFRRVRHPSRLPSITHVDGSARLQTVCPSSCAELHALLTAVRHRTGAGVLCNTSLNFRGRGFINRTSELLHFCAVNGIRHVVIDGTWYQADE